ncbi:MAG: twin-arginine translocase TatA/TatE family subunit [Acidimicrobiia bacterium]|jgi:Tat protein translocase TatB subunit
MLQGPEVVVILLVALVVFGPERLPELARKAGRWAAELRRATRDIRQGLEAEIGDVRGLADEVRKPLKEISREMKDAGAAADDMARPIRWIGPEPQQGPTSGDAMDDLDGIEDRDDREAGGPAEPS